MFKRVLAVGVVMACAAPALAQQPSASVDNPTKRQYQAFESILRAAVERGGQTFAQQVSQVMPNVQVFQAGTSSVIGIPVPEKGLHLFEVQVPGLNATGIFLMNQFRTMPSPRQSASQTVAAVDPNRMRATGADVAPDPMTHSPILDNPNETYVAAVKGALIDALLDSSGVLQLQPDDTLMVVSTAVDEVSPNPLYKPDQAKMYLSVKGSDLADFRQGKITREQAKERIKESRF